MSGIEGLGSIGGPAKATARSATRAPGGPGAFAVPDDAAPASGQVQAPAPATLDGMLALQEAELAAVHERAARRHGQRMLQALARLQGALLGEGVTEVILRELRTLVVELPLSADPALRHLLQSVALRARIELARRAPAQSEASP